MGGFQPLGEVTPPLDISQIKLDPGCLAIDFTIQLFKLNNFLLPHLRATLSSSIIYVGWKNSSFLRVENAWQA